MKNLFLNNYLVLGTLKKKKIMLKMIDILYLL